MFARAGVQGVDTDAGRSRVWKGVIDDLLRLSPMPQEWQALGPVCRRIYAIYGPVMKPAQINRGHAGRARLDLRLRQLTLRADDASSSVTAASSTQKDATLPSDTSID